MPRLSREANGEVERDAAGRGATGAVRLSAALTNLAFKDRRATKCERMVLLFLCWRANDAGFVAQSAPVIAEATLLSERQVRRLVDELEAHGLIVKTGNVIGKVAEYRVILSPDKRVTAGNAATLTTATATPDNRAVASPSPLTMATATPDNGDTATKILKNKTNTTNQYKPTRSSAPDPRWEAFKAELQRRVSPHSYETWFKPLGWVGLNNGVALLSVPTEQFFYVGEKYPAEIAGALQSSGFQTTKFRFVVPN